MIESGALDSGHGFGAFAAVLGGPVGSASATHGLPWEPSWEPFGVDRGGRVWTVVEMEARC